MSFTNMSVTNRGRNLLAKAQSGATLNFTRLRVGSGTFSGNIAELTNLVTPVMWIELNQGKVAGDGRFLVGGYFTNEDITAGFYLRELGVYATDPDLGEILFCYANAGTGAEYIPNNTSSEIIERQLNVTTIVTNASSVTATINESLVFATTTALAEVQNQLTSHAGNANVHVTPAEKASWIGKADANNPKLSGTLTLDNRAFEKYLGSKRAIALSPNQKVKIYVPKMYSEFNFELTVSGVYQSANHNGYVKKVFSGNLGVDGSVINVKSKYLDMHDATDIEALKISKTIQISDILFDSVADKYYINVCYSDNNTSQSTFHFYLKGFVTYPSMTEANFKNFMNGIFVSDFYADSVALPKAKVQLKNVIFDNPQGTAPMEVFSTTRVDNMNVQYHNGWQTFNSLQEVSTSLSDTSTWGQIFNALPNKSEVFFTTGANEVLFPVYFVYVHAIKVSATRMDIRGIRFTDTSYGHKEWLGSFTQGVGVDVKQVPLSDGTLQTNLNSHYLNGFTSSQFYKIATTLPASTDLNTLSVAGDYYCENNTIATTHLNLPNNSINPDSKAYHLRVINTADNERAQELTFFTPATEVWRRRRVAGAWSVWTKGLYQQDIYSQNGFAQTSGPFGNLSITLTPAPTSYYVGLPVKIKLSVDVSGNCNLNVNGLGSKPIYKNQNSRLTRAKAGEILSLVYDGTNFILVSGKGGELNVFAQATLPTDIFEGICIKQDLPINKIVTDSTWFTGGSINPNSSDYALYNSPEPTNVNSCAIGNNLYHSATNRNTIYAINKVTKTNTLVATVPTGLYIVAMIAFGTDIYCTMKSTSYYNSGYLYKYNTVTNAWTLLNSSIATSQYAIHSMFYFNGNIYCSRTAYGDSASYDVYNLSTNTKTYVSDGLSDNSSWIAHSCYISSEFLYMVLTVSNGVVLQIKNMNTGTIVKSQPLTFPAGYDYYNTTNIKIVIESGKLYLVRADYNGLIVFDVPTNVATDFSTGTLVTISTSSSTTAGFSDLCLFTNEIWIMNKGNDKDLIVRYMLTDKSYDAGTVVIKRANQLTGAYQTQLMNNEDLTGFNNRLLTSFDDVAYYNGTSLQTGLPTYYGNGSSWVQFK